MNTKSPAHNLIPDSARAQMLRNGKINAELSAQDRKTNDFEPVVKLFNPAGGATWLLTELDPENEDIAFGLCDLGLGEPELGSVSISEIASVRGRLGLPMERDLYFTPKHPISVYTEKARVAGQIVFDF